MNAEEVMSGSAARHLAWVKRVSEEVPAKPSDAKAGQTDYSEHHADRSASAEQQDALNEGLVKLITKYREEI